MSYAWSMIVEMIVKYEYNKNKALKYAELSIVEVKRICHDIIIFRVYVAQV